VPEDVSGTGPAPAPAPAPQVGEQEKQDIMNLFKGQ
jgi:penicillin-binding protein 1A